MALVATGSNRRSTRSVLTNQSAGHAVGDVVRFRTPPNVQCPESSFDRGLRFIACPTVVLANEVNVSGNIDEFDSDADEAVSSGRALLLRAPKVEPIFVLMQFDIKDAIWKSPRHLWHDSSRLARKKGSVMNTKACQGRVGLEPRRSASS